MLLGKESVFFANTALTLNIMFDKFLLKNKEIQWSD